MTKKDDETPTPEILLSTEDEVSSVSKEKFEEIFEELTQSAEASPGPLDNSKEKYGPLAAEGVSITAALDHEGLAPPRLARKLSILLDSYEPRWNHKTKSWDYFVNSELWRRCIEMIMKIRGDFAPERRVNVNIDVGLEELLKGSVSLSPEEAQEKIKEYIDLEVEIDERG